MICPSVPNGVVLAILCKCWGVLEPLRLELWIEPLGCLNSKMISVGVFEEPSEAKKMTGTSCQPNHPIAIGNCR